MIGIPFDDEEAPAQNSTAESDEATTGEAAEELPVPPPPPVVAAGGTPLYDRLAAGPVRTEFDGCLRCYGPAHDGECPPAL